MHVVVFVVLLVLGILAINGVVWGIVLTALSRRRRARMAELQADLAATGDRVVLGPDRGNYCGGTGDFPRVANNSLLTLTTADLLIHPYLGRAVTVPVAAITGVRVEKAWNGRVVAGKHFLVVSSDHGEVGLFAPDPDRWRSAIERFAVR
ncbi:hypothetical protein [Nocardioides panacisoli]|uniref:DUF2550 family protein n=1 Tax=Nocardioides panacisoli TaxID=627624 RepID=A0ABP7IXY0_9ACTN